MVRLLVWSVAAYVLVVAGVWMFQRRLIYLPTRRVPPIGDVAGGWHEVTFDTADGLTLHAWHVPPQAEEPVVVVFNGNAGNRSDRILLGKALAGEGFGVVLVDYRGYGSNPGHPTESGLAHDARAVLRWVQDHASGHPLVYFGESLGAAVAIELAVTESPDALVLRSPFTSLAAVGAFHYRYLPVRLLLWDEFPSVERIRKVAVPTLVIAGSSDSIIPIDQSRAIYDAASHPKRWVVIDGADHNDPPLATGPDLIEATTKFLAEVIP